MVLPSSSTQSIQSVAEDDIRNIYGSRVIVSISNSHPRDATLPEPVPDLGSIFALSRAKACACAYIQTLSWPRSLSSVSELGREGLQEPEGCNEVEAQGHQARLVSLPPRLLTGRTPCQSCAKWAPAAQVHLNEKHACRAASASEADYAPCTPPAPPPPPIPPPPPLLISSSSYYTELTRARRRIWIVRSRQPSSPLPWLPTQPVSSSLDPEDSSPCTLSLIALRVEGLGSRQS